MEKRLTMLGELQFAFLNFAEAGNLLHEAIDAYRVANEDFPGDSMLEAVQVYLETAPDLPDIEGDTWQPYVGP